MSENIVIVGCSEIREGKLEELKAVMNKLFELVKAKEPQMIAYNAYLKEDGTQLTVIQVHPDSASVELHMEVTGSAFPQELINLSRIDIYGKPSQSLLDKMRLSQTTGGSTVVVHELSTGFSRF
jgi:quinol monooxygenase YgiN